MKQFEEYDEAELRKMEEQLRSLPKPYAAGEPDDRYFANARVRLMERIDAKHAAKQSVFAQVIGWFSASPIRGLATGLAVVIVVFGSVWMLSTPQAPQLATTSPAVTAPTAQPAVEPAKTTPTAPALTPQAEPKPTPNLAKAEAPKQAVADIFADSSVADQSNDVALSGDTDEPVDYAALSADELQAVLDGINH